MAFEIIISGIIVIFAINILIKNIRNKASGDLKCEINS